MTQPKIVFPHPAKPVFSERYSGRHLATGHPLATDRGRCGSRPTRGVHRLGESTDSRPAPSIWKGATVQPNAGAGLQPGGCPHPPQTIGVKITSRCRISIHAGSVNPPTSESMKPRPIGTTAQRSSGSGQIISAVFPLCVHPPSWRRVTSVWHGICCKP